MIWGKRCTHLGQHLQESPKEQLDESLEKCVEPIIRSSMSVDKA